LSPAATAPRAPRRWARPWASAWRGTPLRARSPPLGSQHLRCW